MLRSTSAGRILTESPCRMVVFVLGPHVGGSAVHDGLLRTCRVSSASSLVRADSLVAVSRSSCSQTLNATT